MEKDVIKHAKKVHFIGIGGIGISSIARMLLLEGKKVSGSDRSVSIVTDELAKAGAEISIGHSADHMPEGADLVIYTIAIPADNPELLEAKKRGIALLTYPESLHEISKNKYTIAVSGTHGKTTTTAMIARIMIDAGLDPTVIVGSYLKDHRSNFISGGSDYVVVEACEYRKSFLNIEPDIAVITNIDNDHLDFYKDIGAIRDAFGEFVAKVPRDGWIVHNAQDAIVAAAIRNASAHAADYGAESDNVRLRFPGVHNKANARAALAVARILGIDEEKAKKSLERFAGTWRRFEYKGETKNGVPVYDDYAHHPTEIAAALAGARELFPDKRIVLVFQPHLYSRTKLLMREFETCFGAADMLLVAPIYAARERPDPEISAAVLSKRIRGVPALPFDDFAGIIAYLSEHLQHGDVLITMGAGDIHKIGDTLIEVPQDFFAHI